MKNKNKTEQKKCSKKNRTNPANFRASLHGLQGTLTAKNFWRRFGYSDCVPFNNLKLWERQQLSNAAAEVNQLYNGK